MLRQEWRLSGDCVESGPRAGTQGKVGADDLHRDGMDAPQTRVVVRVPARLVMLVN